MKTISINNIKKNSLKLNKKALQNTEKIVLKTIDKIEGLQKHKSASIKKKLHCYEKQQDAFFKHLEEEKEKIWGKLNKALDFFSKT
ncbi:MULTISPECIES: hypothetical protein [unclassified Polaribacter]|uniref:hypothetical protein n=1 Tax=unclassified Polaribacter TaxID=196858 RepID=UPI0011BFDC00|nr:MULTISPECIES: hypothetical protein [unclassified Polaribacter]TXD51261.1 hypothetical protein ES043_12610 [Polaribacter sp. IC063]TXD58014.1 hypothetical protein ES044_13250 [Polaribacter sp. IC066]